MPLLALATSTQLVRRLPAEYLCRVSVQYFFALHFDVSTKPICPALMYVVSPCMTRTSTKCAPSAWGLSEPEACAFCHRHTSLKNWVTFVEKVLAMTDPVLSESVDPASSEFKGEEHPVNIPTTSWAYH